MKLADVHLCVSVVLVGFLGGLASAQDSKFKFTAPKDIPIPTELKGKAVEVTLESALARAVDNNVDLAVLRLSPGISKQDLVIAKAFYDGELYSEAGMTSTQNPSTSPFAPEITREVYDANLGWRKRFYSGGQLDVSLSALQIDQSVTSISGFPSQLYENGWNLSYTQPLLRSAGWEYGRAAVRRAASARIASDHQFDKDRQDILLSVVQAYWELVFVRENYRVEYQGLELAQEQLRITLARIEVRDLAARDRVADDAEVARRKESLIVAENNIRKAEDDLRALLFRGQDSMWDVVLRPTSAIESDMDVSKLDWRTASAVAMVERPDLKSLQATAEIAEQGVVQAKSELRPRLDLVGSYNSAAIRNDSFANARDEAFGIEYPDWSLRLLFAYPIGNRAAKARLTRASLDLEVAKGRIYAQKVAVRKAVRDAVRNLQTLGESIRASRESVRLGDNDLDTARHKLRVGALTFFDVQQRNQELQEARSRLLRNQLDFRIAEAVLQHSQGLLFREPKTKER
jgi:outer membrane protein